MTLDRRALAGAAAILWGAAMLLTSLAEQVVPGYGAAFLEWAASFYPGYHGPGGLGAAALVTVYGAVDGAVGGWLLAWLYNALAGGGSPQGPASPGSEERRRAA